MQIIPIVAIIITFASVFVTAFSLSITPKRMFAALGQFASSSQFYMFGRSRCTRTGWEKASKAYPKPDILANGRDSKLDLSDKVFMITGANGGIGHEISEFLALQNATVYMVCRSAERGQAAKDAITTVSQNNKLHLLVGDCGLEKDVRRVWNEFVAHRKSTTGAVKLDALVCNAGALLNELTLTEEDVEVTFATHLLFGTYLLGQLAMPTLKNTPNSRLIAVSSGGMYNSKFPAWEVATSTGNAKYDGQFAYVYAKRGQVLLCEQWAKEHGDSVKIVSCHPGWVDTGGVEQAYGENKKYLEPLRSLWEGAEGIVWLCAGPAEQIESGAFYLDRSPQVKHLAGPFFTEGSFTKNTPQEVFEMMLNLQLWSEGQRPTYKESMIEAAKQVPLKPSAVPVDLARFMGDWHVLANIPTSYEVGATNCIEMYELDTKRPNTVKVTFEYSFANASKENSFATSQMKMRGNVKNTHEIPSSTSTFSSTSSSTPSSTASTSAVTAKPLNTFWTIDPKMLGLAVPLGMSYLILDVAEDYSYTLVSVPDRSYLWVMVRATPSEHPPANVRVVDAYPELHMDGFSSNMNAPAGEKQAVKESLHTTPPADPAQDPTVSEATAAAAAVKKDSPVEEEVKAAATEADRALAHAGALEHSTQAAKRHYEIQVLRRALAKANELGFDVNKVLRCPWYNSLEKERAAKLEKKEEKSEEKHGSGDKAEKGEKGEKVCKNDNKDKEGGEGGEKNVSFSEDSGNNADVDTPVAK